MAPPIKTRPSFSHSQSFPSGRFHKLLIHQRVDRMKTTITEKLTKLITWTTAFSNLMKLWAMICRAIQDREVMVESTDKMWSTREKNGKPLQYSCLKNPMNSMERQKDTILKDELPRLVGAQYATGEEWRNNSRKSEETEPKWKQCPVVNRTGDERKSDAVKSNTAIGTWNVRSVSQGKLKVVKQERSGVNIDILWISELKWTIMGKFNSDDHYIYYCGKNPLEEME